jgi:hypothetical protein
MLPGYEVKKSRSGEKEDEDAHGSKTIGKCSSERRYLCGGSASGAVLTIPHRHAAYGTDREDTLSTTSLPLCHQPLRSESICDADR